MLKAEKLSPIADGTSKPPTLADLSRSASVISTSSSDSGRSVLHTPRPRPIRTFTSPRTSSPHSKSPRASRPPAYLAKELGLQNDTSSQQPRSRSRGRNVTINDFETRGTLGEGSYSSVLRVTHKSTGKQFAVKVLDKSYLQRKQKQSVALVEKNALLRLSEGHPGIVRLHYAFQDEWSLYFVLDLATHGEMQALISRMGSLSTVCARYYAAQIIDAVDFMHKKGVIHRDLKPENMLLDDAFRIKITDFGTAKILQSDTVVEKFVGTAQYVAPELVEANETSQSSDLWAIGCVLYQMIAGRFAFHGLSEFLTLQKVKQMDYSFPEGFDADAKDLVERLLVRDPKQRLGAGLAGSSNDMMALRAHPFFASLNWNSLWTDPPPPLQAGLVKKEHPLAQSTDANWEDIGAAWDNLVGHDDVDEIQWAPDAHGPQVIVQRNETAQPKGVEIGPLGEIRSTRAPVSVPVVPQGRDESTFDANPPGSPSTGSPATSSDGGIPIEKINDALKSMRPFSLAGSSPERSSSVAALAEVERGRNQAMTPVQGNAPALNLSLLKLADNEKLLCTSTVEERSLRRRASKLLPLNVSPMKPKLRTLVLTNYRLFCLKQKDKTPDGSTIKLELLLRQEKRRDKERDSRGVLTSVESKGEREFAVMTTSKTYGYAAHDDVQATKWVQNIDVALSSLRALSTENMDTQQRTL